MTPSSSREASPSDDDLSAAAAAAAAIPPPEAYAETAEHRLQPFSLLPPTVTSGTTDLESSIQTLHHSGL